MDDKFERIANITTLLLHDAKDGITIRELMEKVPGYPDKLDSARRQFHRDRDVLEDAGIRVIEEDGRYFIPTEDYWLPELDLTSDERVALNLAVLAVSVGDGEALSGLEMLGGFEPGARDLADAAALRAELGGDVLDLPKLHAAARDRAVVRLLYGEQERDVEPYGLLTRDGYWYLIGHDRLRDERRTFRVDRIADIVSVGERDSFERPGDVDLRGALPQGPWQFGDEDAITAVVRIAPALATKVVSELPLDTTVTNNDDGSVVIELPVRSRVGFRSWLLGMLDHAEVLAPPVLRSDVVAWLKAIAR